MNDQHKIKPYYKQLGPIPKGWNKQQIGSVFSFLNTLPITRENLTEQKTKSNIQCIHYGDIHAKFTKEILDIEGSDDISFVKDDTKIPEDIQMLRNGDVVLADVSEDYTGIGECIELVNVKKKKVIGGLHTIVMRDENGTTCDGYRCYIFKHPKVGIHLKAIATGISVYGITEKNISKIEIPLPPLPEQKAIAAVLSTWDKAKETTQKLIEQKELQKKALMQQLLSGKKRLKGFDGEWLIVHIKDIADEIAIRNTTNSQLTVLSCTKHNGLVPSLEYFGRKVFSNDLNTYKIVPKNTFAYATNHIEEGSIGYQRVYENSLISPMYTTFKTKNGIDDEFLFRVLKMHHNIHEYQKRMEGSIDRRGGLRWEEFSKIKLDIPFEKEQSAINKVITTADKELNLLRQKLKLLNEQKKGLMQKLLTGKVRIKSEGY